MTNVWCGIPVYNNIATIGDVVRRCKEQIANIVVVDDGSTDGNLREVLAPFNVAVMSHSKNLGKGEALLSAFRYAAERGAEYLITIDGDGQHFPEDLQRLIAALRPNTLLIGNRAEVVGTMPRSSIFGREFSDFWIYAETGESVCDTQSGFRAYPLPQVLNLRLGSHHYNLEMEVVTRGIWAGLNTFSVPVRVWYPERAKRVSHFRPVVDNFRISLLHARLVVRQLLPIPHPRLLGLPRPRKSAAERFNHLIRQNAHPLGLAAAAGLSVFLEIVLWPWGWIPAIYLAWRLHLNMVAVVVVTALCMPFYLPMLCLKIGSMVVDPQLRPHLAWFIGSHIVAFVLAPLLALVVYIVARCFQGRAQLRVVSDQ